MKRKELLSLVKRKWDDILHGVKGVYVIPSRRKHDSGWACMDFVAVMSDGTMIRFGGSCDDVSFRGNCFRMDCDYESKCLHIWNCRNTFSISADISSINFIEQEAD
jgi:hypothetical protein